MLAAAKRTSPSVTSCSFGNFVFIIPSPTVTKKMEGPGTAGSTTVSPWGRMHQSISNSSNGGRYLFTYEFIGTPCKISGEPYKKKTDRGKMISLSQVYLPSKSLDNKKRLLILQIEMVYAYCYCVSTGPQLSKYCTKQVPIRINPFAMMKFKEERN